jgi:uncharacterized protein YlxP (DUF503 family)
VVVGVISFDLLLGDVRSLKQKRSVVRPIVAELSRKFSVSAAETGELELHRRAEVSATLVAADHKHVRDVLAECERWVAGRPEVELLSARTRVLDDEDLA